MDHSADFQLNAAFGALADPSRRAMIRLLLHKPRRAGELAECVDMSPQALSRHLRVLRKASASRFRRHAQSL
jgi:DNA-binding transcriptional ArsR family regulator